MKQNVVFSKNIIETAEAAVAACKPDKIFIVTDNTTKHLCLPLIMKANGMADAKIISIPPTDTNKDLEHLAYVWSEMQNGGATRHSCTINLGGGMITDLGGFAASTFKRGMNFINIPTTLLAMVDASIGGKTGINFGGLKNEIGVFNNAVTVIIDTSFLATLNSGNMLSGYAEMLKHGLLSNDKMWAELLQFNILQPDLAHLQAMVEAGIQVKEHIVETDPHETGLRKALNLGHTIGHAFESFSLSTEHPLLHGYSVAYGLIGELYLSCIKAGFPTAKMHQTAAFIREHYGRPDINCKDYTKLLELMRHDKKNTGQNINFTLLADVGDIRINQTATDNEIYEALDFIREGL